MFDVTGVGSAEEFIKSRGSIGIWRSNVRPCFDLWDRPRLLTQPSMSQRPVDSHDEANTNKDGQSITLPPLNIHQQAEEPQARHEEASSSDAPAPPAGEQYAQQSSTPYPPTQPTDARPTPPPSRSLGVHNILNPAEPDDVKPRSSPAGPASLAASTREQTHNKADLRPSTRQKRGLQSPSLSSNEGSDQLRPRKTLYPKSPRSMSLGGGGTGVFLQDTKQSGTGASTSSATAAYTATPGTYAGAPTPPMPTAHQQTPYSYNLPPPISTPPIDRRRSSATTALSGLSQSQTTSPNISYFTYSLQPSPAQPPPPTQGPWTPSQYQPMMGQSMGGLRPSQPAVTQQPEGSYMPPMHGNHLSMSGDLSGAALAVGGHPSVAGMQDRYSVPVDRVSGSRNADEKRKHNAAASSRFRERRKKLNEELKKENDEYAKRNKELEESLEQLERMVQDTGRQRDFYRDAYNRLVGSGRLGMLNPPIMLAPYVPPSYGHPSTGTGPLPSNEEERPAQRRRTEGPEQGEAYNLPPAATYQSPPFQPKDDGRLQGLHIPCLPQSAPGSMSAPSGPSSVPRSPYEQYPPATNGGVYFRGQHSGPSTPGSS